MERQARRVHPLMIPLFLLALLLNACADGPIGSVVAPGGGAIVAPGGCGEELTTPEGIWIGSILSPGTTQGSALIAMIADGDMTVIQLAPNTPLNNPIPTRLYVGQYDPTTLTGTVQVFSGRGKLLQNGTLNIALQQRLNISLGGGAATLLSLCPMRDNNTLLLYERDTVFQGQNQLPGLWRYNVPANQQTADPGYNLDITMTADGGLEGLDSLQCEYRGAWHDPRPDRNLYRLVDLTLSSVNNGTFCDIVDPVEGFIRFAGQGYNGFAMYFDATSATDRVLWTVVSNGEAAFFTAFDRVGPSLLPAPPINDPFEDEFS